MGIIDKKKQYWGALSKKNGEIQRIQIMSENPVKIYKVFKTKRKVTFITNADTIHVEGTGNVSTVTELWEGEQVVTFSKPDHRTETVKIIVAEEDLTVEKYLVRTHGQLNIQSSPAGANVYINNVNMGVTPLTLNSFAFGSYAVSLTKSGYYTATFNVNFNTHPQTASATLTPTPVVVPDPEPPVIPGVPDPVNPPGCVNPQAQVTVLNRTSARCFVAASTSSSPPDRYELFLDGNFLTQITLASGSYMLSNLVPGRTYHFRAVIYCKNGASAGAGQTFTMPK